MKKNKRLEKHINFPLLKSFDRIDVLITVNVYHDKNHLFHKHIRKVQQRWQEAVSNVITSFFW